MLTRLQVIRLGTDISTIKWDRDTRGCWLGGSCVLESMQGSKETRSWLGAHACLETCRERTGRGVEIWNWRQMQFGDRLQSWPWRTILWRLFDRRISRRWLLFRSTSLLSWRKGRPRALNLWWKISEMPRMRVLEILCDSWFLVLSRSAPGSSDPSIHLWESLWEVFRKVAGIASCRRLSIESS